MIFDETYWKLQVSWRNLLEMIPYLKEPALGYQKSMSVSGPIMSYPIYHIVPWCMWVPTYHWLHYILLAYSCQMCVYLHIMVVYIYIYIYCGGLYIYMYTIDLYIIRVVNIWDGIDFKLCLTHWPLGDLNEIFKLILVIVDWGISCDIALRWMSLDLTDDESTLVQVMAWCRQPTSHYLSQCWPGSLSPYGVTRPQWVNSLKPVDLRVNWVRVNC